MIKNGEIYEAYDGSSFYSIDHAKKTISFYEAGTKGGIAKIIEKNARYFLLYSPYLKKEKAFDLGKFQDALIDTLDTSTGKSVRITVLDSFVNELKVLPSDPIMAQVEEIYEKSLSDFTLYKKQEIIKFLASPYYLEKNFSSFTTLPDSVTFDQIFNVPLLLSSEYELRNTLKNFSPQRSKPIPEVGDTISAFKLPDLEGKELSSDAYTDGLILLDFWYMSCAPCIMAMPVIERLHQKYKDKGLIVLGMNGFDKNPATIKTFMKERAVTYHTLLDTNRKIAEQLQIRGYPTMLLIEAKSRKVLMAHSGFSLEIESKVSEFMEERLKGN